MFNETGQTASPERQIKALRVCSCRKTTVRTTLIS